MHTEKNRGQNGVLYIPHAPLEAPLCMSCAPTRGAYYFIFLFYIDVMCHNVIGPYRATYWYDIGLKCWRGDHVITTCHQHAYVSATWQTRVTPWLVQWAYMADTSSTTWMLNVWLLSACGLHAPPSRRSIQASVLFPVRDFWVSSFHW